MTHTDPIADMLTRIRNGFLIQKKTVAIPYSKIKEEIVKIFQKDGYITGYKIDKTSFPAALVVELKYMPGKISVIEGLKRVSKPGRRVYVPMDDIPKALDGMGVSILSTPQGVFSGKECKKRNLGGEVLVQIW